MLDISIPATLQQHKCKVRGFSFLANTLGMDGLEADTQLINDLLGWAGKNATTVASEIGAAVTTITRPANRKATTRLGRKTLEALRAKYPDYPGWGAVTAGEASLTKIADQPVMRSPDAGETVEIVQLDLSLPMGPGASVDEYIEEEPVRFDLSYIRGFTRTPPTRLRIARGVGDSMYPTLVSSDLVWIDSTQTQLNQQDRIWAVSINGAAAIKRLRAIGKGKVLVVSDNPAVDNYEVEAVDVLIGGRVIRFARDL